MELRKLSSTTSVPGSRASPDLVKILTDDYYSYLFARLDLIQVYKFQRPSGHEGHRGGQYKRPIRTCGARDSGRFYREQPAERTERARPSNSSRYVLYWVEAFLTRRLPGSLRAFTFISLRKPLCVPTVSLTSQQHRSFPYCTIAALAVST